jgi:two-component system alkaline phosphatase synthesis response regulator PhoP
MKILVVDDEKDIVDLISLNLERDGYKVIPAYSGEEALELVRTKKPDLIILDLMLPGVQGLEVCRQVRAEPEHADVLILILSAKDGEIDRVLGLEMGADDYVVKPFSMRELTARVRAALRRTDGQRRKGGKEGKFSRKGLLVDFDKYEVAVAGKKVDLSPIEMKLLSFFTKNPGRVYTRDQLLHKIWGDAFVTPRSVDVHISHLRKLIEQDTQNPAYILTVTGVGYKFDDSD